MKRNKCVSPGEGSEKRWELYTAASCAQLRCCSGEANADDAKGKRMAPCHADCVCERSSLLKSAPRSCRVMLQIIFNPFKMRKLTLHSMKRGETDSSLGLPGGPWLANPHSRKRNNLDIKFLKLKIAKTSFTRSMGFIPLSSLHLHCVVKVFVVGMNVTWTLRNSTLWTN